jgi:PKD repeat protein
MTFMLHCRGRSPTPLGRAGFVLFLLIAFTIFAIPSLFAADIEPTASFTISPNRGSIGTTFSFDASTSYDQRGFSNALEYRWNFEYSGADFSSWSSDPTTTYEYETAGEKTVALEVRDEEGLTDRTYSTLTVSEDQVFDAWFDVSPTAGDTTTEFLFTADVSTPLSTPASEYEFRWDFDGDGEYDTDYSSSEIQYHTYGDTAYYNPRLEVLSPDGDTLVIIGYDDGDDEETSYVFVTESDYPNASINVYPSTGSTATTFYFDASQSFDGDDGRDIEYRWDLNGDGAFELDWSEEENQPTTQYDTPGDYEVTVQVRDSDGQTDEASLTLTISEDDFPPEADFTITSDSGLTDKTIGTTSTTFTFNGSSSDDEEDSSSELQVRWDFNGDGEYDTTFSDTKSAEHQYSDPDTYTITMEVMDSSGQTDETQDTVTVVSNDEPVATFYVSPTTGTPGTSFSFDASDVSDSQYRTTVLEVRWDFDGDGEYDTSFSTDKTTTHDYDDAGTYEITMQVRDPESATATATATVIVFASTGPVADLSVDVTSGTFSTLFHFDASASYDGETDDDDLLFRWDFEYTGANDLVYDTSWTTSSTKTHYFDQTGEVRVRVEVKDGDDEVSTSYLTVYLHWASEYMETLKDNGVIRGYTGGDLQPDQAITRAELLKMAMEAADLSISGHTFEGIFSDVKSTDWFDAYAEKGYGYGIVSGYSDGTFRPNDSVTRAEATKIILEAFEVDFQRYGADLFPDVDQGSWYEDYIGTAYTLGLVSGHEDGSFYPDWSMTRGEASKIIALAMQGNL